MTVPATTQMIVSIGRRKAEAIDSLDQAVAICGTIRDTADYGSGIGARDYYSREIGNVYIGTTLIARVHYNGRIEQFESEADRKAVA